MYDQNSDTKMKFIELLHTDVFNRRSNLNQSKQVKQTKTIVKTIYQQNSFSAAVQVDRQHNFT
jgi:hypothetical protein